MYSYGNHRRIHSCFMSCIQRYVELGDFNMLFHCPLHKDDRQLIGLLEVSYHIILIPYDKIRKYDWLPTGG